MQPFEYPSVRYWSKEINGTLPGGRKTKFNSRPRAPYGLEPLRLERRVELVRGAMACGAVSEKYNFMLETPQTYEFREFSRWL